jgi:Xaa-Pro aminopeptidase
MKRSILVLTAWFLAFPAAVAAQDYQAHFPPEEFQARWARVFDKIGPEAVAVLQGAPDPGGFVYPRQSNNFYYLCGVENPFSYLLLDGQTKKVTLYLSGRGIGQGDRVLSLNNVDRAKQLTGVNDVLGVDRLLAPDPQTRGRGPRVIYTPFSPAEGQGQSRGELQSRDSRILADSWDGRVSREANFVAHLMTRFPRAEIRDMTPILDEMRTIKSPREIELLRRAGQMSALAVLEAMKSTKAGLYEYELEAVARYVFAVNGARLEGYRSILPSGVANTADAHYFSNAGQLTSGDLVLMDYAPDYGYYTSDIGRMWPVSGKFAPWQRELCQFILEYEKAILQRIRPGLLVKDIMADARAAMEAVFSTTTFSKPEYEKAARSLVETGGGVFSHTVGMTVHDVGNYVSAPLKPGQVFTIDPQLRVPEENLYMRIEDTIVITETGIENLTRFAPSELGEIEKAVTGEGVLRAFPPVPPPPVK